MNTNVPPAFYRKHTLWIQISPSVLQGAHIVDTNFPKSLVTRFEVGREVLNQKITKDTVFSVG